MRFLRAPALAVSVLAFCSTASAQTYAPLNCTAPATPISKTLSYSFPGTSRNHVVDIQIAIPTGLPAGVTLPLPAVIWSHGGSSGGNPTKLEDWRTATVEACYVSISIGHNWPDKKLARKICEDVLHVPFPTFCGDPRTKTYKLLNLTKPYDIAEVIDHIMANHADEIDINKIAVAGHSFGAFTALAKLEVSRQLLEVQELHQSHHL